MSHTKGPWTVDVWDYPHKKELVVQAEQYWVASLNWDEGKDNPYTISSEEAQANARLIASAPAMLEALEEASVSMADASRFLNDEDAINMNHVRDLVEQAIAQAKGQEVQP